MAALRVSRLRKCQVYAMAGSKNAVVGTPMAPMNELIVP